MMNRCLDLELLRTFVGVVDSGGFTRAGARLFRSQSTISQQIKRLEEQIGKPLLMREGRSSSVTEAGETLLGYARRMLVLDDEARAVLVRSEADEIIRVGVSEDFANRHLARVLATFGRKHPGVRLDIRADLSANLQRDYEVGDLDVALLKGDVPSPDADRQWRERLFWIGSKKGPLPSLEPVPLALFPQGCVFRRQALERLDTDARHWRVAFVSPSLAGLQAAVAAGIAISPIGESSLSKDLKVLDHRLLGLPELSPVWFSLVSRRDGERQQELCEAMTGKLDASWRRTE